MYTTGFICSNSLLFFYDAEIKETASLTEAKIELDESTLAIFNDKLQIILDNLDTKPEVTVTYFKPDTKKAGGAYIDHTDIIKRIDDCERTVIFMDKTAISIEDIIDIQSEILPETVE